MTNDCQYFYHLTVLHFSFVFFKQKTAYEMRISDWSSDVCSSDLIWPLPLLIVGVLGGIFTGIFTATEAGAIGAFLAVVIAVARRQFTLKEIGRASCRERVCQSV